MLDDQRYNTRLSKGFGSIVLNNLIKSPEQYEIVAKKLMENEDFGENY